MATIYKKCLTGAIPGKYMMSKDEKEIVSIVYRRFIDNESDELWTDLDENLIFFEYLSDKDAINEAKVKILKHKGKGIFRCQSSHEHKYCFAPVILEAVEAIVKLYDEFNGPLHPINRYVLMYYLSMSEMGLIYLEN